MPQESPRSPRPQHPLPAVLAGAGFFILLAVLGRPGLLGRWDQSLWQASQPGTVASEGGQALRLVGAPSAASPAARALGLAQDVAWLRAHGVGVIVLEAWLDEAPQADAMALAEDLRRRLEALPSGRTRKSALSALSQSSEALVASDTLAKALGAAQPLLLAFGTVSGHGRPLPQALGRQAYEVTLHNLPQSLPEQQPLHLPYDQALQAVGRAGAVPFGAGESVGQGVQAVVGMDGRWFNVLGLEAARLALGLPMEGLRYRWKQGRLSSLEMKGVRYPLDGKGRLSLPDTLLPLATLTLDRAKADPVLQSQLRGKAVFLCPWPTLLGDSGAFQEQERLFQAVVGRDVLTPPTATAQWILWFLLGALGLGLLAMAPLWAALLGWALLPLASLWAFAQDPQSLTQPWGLALSSLLIGVGWRMQRASARRMDAERLLGGRVSARHQLDWRGRLSGGKGSLEVAYAAVGPRDYLKDQAWEAWMDQWGALVDDDLGVDGLGLLLPDIAHAPAALDDLRRVLGPVCGVSVGTLSFSLGRRLGAPAWQWRGPAREEALVLFHLAKPRQILFSERDYPHWRDLVQVQLVGMDAPASLGTQSGQLLNVLSVVEKL
jgi:hypothetical protein